MKTFYCVASAFYDDGRCVAGIVDSVKAEKKPQSTFKQGTRADLYCDWFHGKKEAMKFVKETMKA